MGTGSPKLGVPGPTGTQAVTITGWASSVPENKQKEHHLLPYTDTAELQIISPSYCL